MRRFSLAVILLFLIVVGGAPAAQAFLPVFDLFGRAFESGTDVQIEGEWFFVNGEPVILKGIQYPWARPGKSPWEWRVDSVTLRRDIERMKSAGFNCVRIYEATPNELEAFRTNGLLVLQQIWIDPQADFGDDRVIEEYTARVRRFATYTRNYDNVVGYLLMNEPQVFDYRTPNQYRVLETFLRVLTAEIKRVDPGASVSMADWPQLAHMDHSFYDFVCFNTYSWSPVGNTENGMGYRAVNEWLKEHVAAGRPYINTEYGSSCSPTAKSPGYGGESEEAQAELSAAMLNDLIQAGSAGAHYTHWADQWFMVGPNWRHDDDPEEWFGLIAFEGTAEPYTERLRPVYDAVADAQWAVVHEPRDLVCYGPEVPVNVYTESNIGKVTLYLDGETEITLEKASLHWWRTTLALSEGTHTIQVVACDESGFCRAPVTRTFIVSESGRSADERQVTIETPETVSPGGTLLVRVRVTDGLGRPVAGVMVRHSLEYQGLWNDDHWPMMTNAEGIAESRVTLKNTYDRGYLTVTAGVDCPPREGVLRRVGDMSFVWVQ